jgi:hypothetical protein
MLPSVLMLLGFAAGPAGAVVVVPAAPTGAGQGAKRYKKYPRRLFINGQVVLVRSAEEERRLLAAMAERAEEQARIAQALGDEQIAQVATRKALKLKKRAESSAIDTALFDDDEIIMMAMGGYWVEPKTLKELQDEDDEILAILLH